MVRLVKTEPEQLDKQPQTKQTPSPKATRRKRRWWKIPLLVIFALAFLSSGWFTYKIASATNKIFAENTTGGSPVLQGKKLDSDKNKRINILLLGIGGAGHDGPNLTDTIQVASVDPKAKTVTMLSIPRDLYVQVPGSYEKVKINEIHAVGEDRGSKGGGPALAKEEVADILDVPIHYFIRVDFDGFQQLVDAVGGVDVNVQERLYDPYYPRGYGYQVLDIKPGLQHMNGGLALKYARSRETTSDFDRSRRQQEVLVAVRDKATTLQYLANPAKISQLVDIVGDHIKTDLSLSEAQKLAQIIRDIPNQAITSKVLDNAPTGLLYDSVSPSGAYILLPRAGDYSGIREFANQLFADPVITQERARIEIQNASGRGGLAKQEGDALVGYGYAIVGVTNAPQLAQTTIIYDYSNGLKPATVDFLARRYKAQVIKQPGQSPEVDIRVVVGTDYTPPVSSPAYQSSQVRGGRSG